MEKTLSKRNRAKCRLCGDVIESKHRHDFVVCKCGSIFIDGGQDYCRCGTLKEGVSFNDILEVEDEEI